MDWSRIQIRYLRYYVTHADCAPTFAEFVPKLALRFLVGIAIGVGVYLCFAADAPIFASFSIGMLAGAAVRDVRNMVSAIRTWPLVSTVTDWGKVRELAEAEGLVAKSATAVD